LTAVEWRVLIADDEPAARRGVRQRLAAFPEFVVVSECRDGAEVLAVLDVVKPDVIFLDIQMPGIDGFEVIRRRTPDRMPVVVFLTAYDEFAIRAFEAEALDYLLKPVTEARFAAAIKRVKKQLAKAAETEREASIVVGDGNGMIVIPLREIDWIEAADNYARIWTAGKSYLLRESLRELEQRVQAHGFLRAHRSALVRLQNVRSLSWTESGELIAILLSGVKVPISRRKRAAFQAALRSSETNGGK
jgi:two-component system, LytTR family, response regulator